MSSATSVSPASFLCDFCVWRKSGSWCMSWRPCNTEPPKKVRRRSSFVNASEERSAICVKLASVKHIPCCRRRSVPRLPAAGGTRSPAVVGHRPVRRDVILKLSLSREGDLGNSFVENEFQLSRMPWTPYPDDQIS